MTDSDSEVQFNLRGTNTDHGSSEPSRPPSENANANMNNSYVTIEVNDEPKALPASNTHEIDAGDDEFSTPSQSPYIQKK